MELGHILVSHARQTRRLRHGEDAWQRLVWQSSPLQAQTKREVLRLKSPRKSERGQVEASGAYSQREEDNLLRELSVYRALYHVVQGQRQFVHCVGVCAGRRDVQAFGQVQSILGKFVAFLLRSSHTGHRVLAQFGHYSPRFEAREYADSSRWLYKDHRLRVCQTGGNLSKLFTTIILTRSL